MALKTQKTKEKGMNLASDSSSRAKFCRELSGFIYEHKDVTRIRALLGFVLDH